ncbi:MAG: Uma2 family endonuclease [Alphaproteobacteria bacterium]|nr:Uma2 family endonuclease [Alphaproteobacteria bacterium]
MLAIHEPHLTEEEFLRLPEGPHRMELLDGQVVVSPAPLPLHQREVLRLTLHLHAWVQAQASGAWEVVGAPLDTWFGPGRILEPDLVLFPRRPGDREHPVRVLPALVVEVSSPSTRRYDRETKRRVYADAGVPELWLVDPEGAIDVAWGPGLAAELAVGTLAPSPTLPGLSVDARRGPDAG